MFCRRALHRLGPLALKTAAPPSRNAVPARQMSFGIPGGSATNMAYIVLCGGGITAAVVYAYKSVSGGSTAEPSPKSAEEGSVSAILGAVKFLAVSNVEIATASVGEIKIINAFLHLEEKVRETAEVTEPAEDEATVVAVVEEVSAKAEDDVVVDPEGPNSEEAVGHIHAVAASAVEELVADVISEAQEAVPNAEEVMEKTPAVAEEEEVEGEEKDASPLEEVPASTPVVEEVGEAEVSTPEAAQAEEAPVEQVPVAEEVHEKQNQVPVAEEAHEGQSPVAELTPVAVAALAEEPAEPVVEATEVAESVTISEQEALIVAASQLAAASALVEEVLSAVAVTEAEPAAVEEKATEIFHSCHSAAVPASEAADALDVEVAPPAVEEDPVGALLEEGSVEMAEEAEEEVPPLAEQARVPAQT